MRSRSRSAQFLQPAWAKTYRQLTSADKGPQLSSTSSLQHKVTESAVSLKVVIVRHLIILPCSEGEVLFLTL